MPGTRNHRTHWKSSKTQSLLLQMCRIAQAFFHSSLPNSILNLETGGWLYRTHGQEVTFTLWMKNHVEPKRSRDLDISVVSVRSMFCPRCHLLHCALVRGHLISLGLKPRHNWAYRLNYAKFLFRFIGLLINRLVSSNGGKNAWLVGSECWADSRIWCHFPSGRFKRKVILLIKTRLKLRIKACWC